MKTSKSFPLVTVCLFVLFQFLSFAYFTNVILEHFFPVLSLILILVLSLLVMLVLWTFFLSVFKNPGFLDLVSTPTSKSSPEQLDEIKKKTFQMKKNVNLVPIAFLIRQIQMLTEKLQRVSTCDRKQIHPSILNQQTNRDHSTKARTTHSTRTKKGVSTKPLASESAFD